MQEESRYLRYLPAIYHDNSFLAGFLLIFEKLMSPVEDILDQIDGYFVPSLTPADFLPWLALWLDLALDEHWPEHKRRQLVRHGFELYRWRGTRRGLRGFLRLYLGRGQGPEIFEEDKAIVIAEEMAPGTGSAFRFTVTLRVPEPAEEEKEQIRAIIGAEKPAHTTFTLEWA
jgi:phage tail-like protein